MKKFVSIIISIVLVLAITLPSAALSTIAVKSIKLNNNKINLKVGQTSYLKVTFTPANTTQKKITFVTGNKRIVTINTDGKITGVSVGSTTITVYTFDKKMSIKCKITVTKLVDNSKPITIKMFGWKRMDEVNYLFSGFKKIAPNITIEYESIDGDKALDVLKTRMIGGVGPDIYQAALDTVELNRFIQAGYIEDLTNKPYLSNFNDGVLDMLREPNGKLYQLPTALTMVSMFYNKDLFAQAGITDVPKTWPEFMAICEKLKSKGIAPIGGSYKDSWTLQLFLDKMKHNAMSVAERKIQNTNINNSKMKFSDPNSYYRKTLTEFAELAQKGYILDGSLGLNYDSGIQAFAIGKCAMFEMGTWAIAQFAKVNDKLNMGGFAIPGNDKKVGKILINAAAADPWIISGKSKPEIKAACDKFFEYLCTKEANTEYATKTSQFPCIKGAVLKVDSKVIQTPVDEFSKYLDSVEGDLSDNPEGIMSVAFQEGRQAIYDSLSKIIAEPKTSVDSVLTDADKAFTKASKR